MVSPTIENEINALLILSTQKLKQDQNNQEFYTSAFQSILAEIYNIKDHKGSMSGGANLKQLFVQLLVLVMTFKTSMSSSAVAVCDEHQLQYTKDLQDTRDVKTILSVPALGQYYFHTEHENIMKYKTNRLIVSSVASLNRHHMTMVSTRSSELSSASKITNLC